MKNIIVRAVTATVMVCVLYGCQEGLAEKEFSSSPTENFDALWKILDERYCYFGTKGIDWDSVYREYYPRLSTVYTVYDLFDLMADMINTLDDGHVNLYAPFDVSSCPTWYTSYPTNYNSSLIYSPRYLGGDYRIAGGMYYNTIGEKKDIGYIRYESFSSGFGASNLWYIDKYFAECKGIIIDVRHNGGGSLSYSESLAACFFSEETLTGYIRHKTGPGHEEFSDPVEVRTSPADAPIDWSGRKVVVLCNRRSYSATNDFVVRCLQAPNVTVIGGRTGGGGGMPLSQELPIGWMVRFSAVPMYDADMQTTEFGVEPDESVTLAESDVERGYDTIIERALEIINGEA